MTTRTTGSPGNRSRAGRIGTLAIVLSALLIGACDGLLDVDASTKTVPAEQLNNPTSFPARMIGAEADFFFSYDMAIVYGGLFTDELIDATGFTAVDERRVTADNGAVGSTDEAEEGIDGLWTPVQRAIFVSDQLQDDILDGAFERIRNPQASAELARVSMFNGFAKTMLADLFCTTAFAGTGPEYTSEETYRLAADEFTLAIDAAQAEPAVRDAALVGRARARLQFGDEQGALADARRVAPEFEYVANVYSTNSQREENDLWNMMFDSQRFSVGPEFRGLRAGNEDDPRVEIRLDPNDGVGTDGFTPLWQPMKYSNATSPIRLASGAEARYIIAEIVGGQEAVDILNAVRARNGISARVTADGPDGLIRVLEEEKSRTLFLEGQRMGDLRRYADRYGLDLFPTGENFGDQTCMPLPNAERNNNPGLRG